MQNDQLVQQLPTLLPNHWRLVATQVEPLAGGMNSATVLVTRDDQQWVAKWVRDSGRDAFAFGLDVATRLAAGGLRSGRPVPTVDGRAMIALEQGALALLEHVPGRELTDDDADQPELADALARAHALLATSMRRQPFLPELGDDPRLGEVADWILPSIETVQAEYRTLPPLTWGLLHGDPSPEAFRADPDGGEVGIIDWAGAGEGPLLYDVASAVMYLGGRSRASIFLQHYIAGAPLPAGELERHLSTFERLRGIVQADYFGRRLLHHDLTGISSEAENHKGLDDAREMLRALGL